VVVPTSSSPTTSGRLLALLSLLQARRDWPGRVLAGRLAVSERTVRRDVDRLRELGYPIHATKGPDGGYRLAAGNRLPPLLFDDEQAVALAVALRTAVGSGAGIEEAAARALTTIRQLMPGRLQRRVDALDVLEVQPGPGAPQADTEVLLTIGRAIRAREELRFDYRPVGSDADADALLPPPRQVQPHHLLARAGRWYLVAWNPRRGAWRIYRADRIRPRIPNGPRFEPRPLPGGDAAAYLAGRFKGSDVAGGWPCRGEVVLALPAADVIPFAGDAVVEALDEQRSRVTAGSWSWAGLAASLARFDAGIEVVGPPELRAAFADLAARAARAAGPRPRG
jgi:predicted DNA-binding transcriptional regulator YafY